MADFRPPYIKNPLDHSKLVLTAGIQPNAKFPPNLRYSIYNGNPRIVVQTNIPEERDMPHGDRITAAMDMEMFYMYLEYLLLVADTEVVPGGPPIKPYAIENYKEKKSDPPKTITYIGKDVNGVVFVTVVDALNKNRKPIKFKFGCPWWHTVIKPNGDPATEADISPLRVRAHVNMVREIMANVFVSTYVPPEPKAKTGGGGYTPKPSAPPPELPEFDEDEFPV